MYFYRIKQKNKKEITSTDFLIPEFKIAFGLGASPNNNKNNNNKNYNNDNVKKYNNNTNYNNTN